MLISINSDIVVNEYIYHSCTIITENVLLMQLPMMSQVIFFIEICLSQSVVDMTHAIIKKLWYNG
jgi:hypothetical protein